MNAHNFDPWDELELSPPDIVETHKKKEQTDPWDELDFDEGFWKSAFRYAVQPAIGIAQGTPYGLFTNLSNLLASGDVFDPEEIDRIKEISKREGIPFDEEKYLQGAREALESFPTPSNLARQTEELTGLPLEAKTRGQKALQMGFTAGKVQPGTLAQKATAGVIAPGVSQSLESAGVPEPISEALGYVAGGIAGSKAPAVEIGKAKKPSGMTERQFEKLKEPREISEKKMTQINEKIESDFRDISNKIIEETPIEKTRSTLKENPNYKNEVGEQFQVVEKLAESIPGKIKTESIKNILEEKLNKNQGTGISGSEYQEDLSKFLNDYIKKTSDKEITASDLVKQYRENNRSLSEYYDPGRSKAYNRAKKDALLEYNRAIAETIEKEYPNTEFSKLFPEQNKKWAQINDAESINDFIDGVFDGKVNFNEARKFFDNENLARPFKRALGEEGFKQFSQLMNDLLSSQIPYKMLKVAKEKGFGDLFVHGLSYVISPKLGIAKSTYEGTKYLYKKAIETVLDKPQLAITWKKGIDNLKKGNFEVASKEFKTLESESEKNRVTALGKFKEKMRKKK